MKQFCMVLGFMGIVTTGVAQQKRSSSLQQLKQLEKRVERQVDSLKALLMPQSPHIDSLNYQLKNDREELPALKKSDPGAAKKKEAEIRALEKEIATQQALFDERLFKLDSTVGLKLNLQEKIALWPKH